MVMQGPGDMESLEQAYIDRTSIPMRLDINIFALWPNNTAVLPLHLEEDMASLQN